MTADQSIFREPDLSARRHRLAVERHMPLPPASLYRAWTAEFDRWFAAPGSVLMSGQVNTPFFFETEFQHDGNSPLQRHPHYGRFLALIPDRLVQMTWLTGAAGTKGAETVVTVELIAKDNGTLLKLSHSGFPDEESMEQHREAWPWVLGQLEERYTVTGYLR
jgi:uncharacterized protein YndB with AHSA1/START domain